MNTLYDIDDVIYVPTKVERIVKTSNGSVMYCLRTDSGRYQINMSEEEIEQNCVVIPDEHWCLDNGLWAFTGDGGKTYQLAVLGNKVLVSKKQSDESETLG